MCAYMYVSLQYGSFRILNIVNLEIFVVIWTFYRMKISKSAVHVQCTCNTCTVEPYIFTKRKFLSTLPPALIGKIGNMKEGSWAWKNVCPVNFPAIHGTFTREHVAVIGVHEVYG